LSFRLSTARLRPPGAAVDNLNDKGTVPYSFTDRCVPAASSWTQASARGGGLRLGGLGRRGRLSRCGLRYWLRGLACVRAMTRAVVAVGMPMVISGWATVEATRGRRWEPSWRGRESSRRRWEVAARRRESLGASGRASARCRRSGRVRLRARRLLGGRLRFLAHDSTLATRWRCS